MSLRQRQQCMRAIAIKYMCWRIGSVAQPSPVSAIYVARMKPCSLNAEQTSGPRPTSNSPECRRTSRSRACACAANSSVVRCARRHSSEPGATGADFAPHGAANGPGVSNFAPDRPLRRRTGPPRRAVGPEEMLGRIME
jgi:hypothetical protein